MSIIDVRNLRVSYGQVTAIWDVSLSVEEGELVAVVGPNGAGKTSLLNTLSGLVKVVAGSISYFGRDLGGLPAHRRAVLGLCQCPEGRKLFVDMTVEENLILGAYSVSERGQAAAQLQEVFALFPQLQERRTQIARTLSGGEQQMVAIGRAMMARPRLLLLDEPSLGLAPKIVLEVFRAIEKIREKGTPILIVEQNVRQTLQIADRGYVMENGRIMLVGPGKELVEHEHIRKAYLGLH